jgi:hypothetical protein
MGQVSKFLRRGQDRYFHWCPACQRMHPLPDAWSYNGDLEKPTFTPSFKHNFTLDNGDKAVCHYILTDGMLTFCADSTHALASKTVPMQPLPPEHRDGGERLTFRV